MKTFVRRMVCAALAFSFVSCRSAIAGYAMPIGFPGYTNRTEVLTSFPALVVLSNNVGGSGFDYTGFLSTNGWDLRFRDAANTTDLNYEIESWNTNGASYVWVQVPTLPNDGTGSILAKWGDPAASNQLACTTDGTTWNSSYGGVWHFREASGTKHYDSTANANTSTATSVTFGSAGPVGSAVYYNGSTAYSRANDAASLKPASNLTVSAWFKPTGAGTQTDGVYPVCKGVSTNDPWLSYGIMYRSDTDLARARIAVGSTTYSAYSTTMFPEGTAPWAHAAFTYDGSTCRLYINGAQQSTTNVSGTLNYTMAQDSYLHFGEWGHSTTFRRFNGYLDEVRVEGSTRSSNWVWACWLNMASNATFNTYGAMTAAATMPSWSGMGVSDVTVTSAVAHATLGGTNADVFLFWDTTDQGLDPAAWGNTNFVGSNQNLGAISGAVMSNLTSGANYAYRFYGTNTATGGTGWSPLGTFITGEITVTATVASVSEAGPGTGQFTVYRPGGLTNAALTVNYSVGGTAVAGTDYQMDSTSSVTIPAGAASATVAVTPVDGQTVGDRAVTLTLQPGTYVVGVPSNDTVTILDNEVPGSAFMYKASITFNGYAGGETLTNFPALVVFAPDKIAGFAYSQVVSTNGYDVKFYSSDGLTVLNHEIDKWDPTSNSYVWVQVPALANGTVIWAHWGSAGQAAAPAAYTTNGATWANGYAGVWHMKEGSGSSADDSTANANAGTLMSSPSWASGVVDGSLKFTASSSQYVRVPQNGKFNLSSKAFTISVCCSNDFTAIGRIVSWYDGAKNIQLGAFAQASPSAHHFFLLNDSAVTATKVYSTEQAGGAWRRVDVTFDGGTGYKMYVNGADVTQAGADVAGSTYGVYTTDSTYLRMATRGTDSYLTGVLDELRVSTVARSAAWINACFLNQASNTEFGVYGAMQLTAPGQPVIANAAATNITVGAACLNGWLTDTGAAPASVTVYWGPTDGGTNKGSWAYTNEFGQFDGSVPLPAWYTTNVTLPASNTFYYYRYEAENGGPAVWASSAEHFLGGEVWVNPAAVTAAESVGGGVATPVPGTVTVWRASQATNGDTVVSFTLSGTATNGADFTVSPSATTVTIPAGLASVDVIFTPIFDRTLEGNKTVTLTLDSGAYAIGSPSASTVTIEDNTNVEPVVLYWDNQSGNRQWDKTSFNWHQASNPPGADRFFDGDSAYFSGSGMTVTQAEDTTVGTVDVSGTGAWTWKSSGGSVLTVTNKFTYGSSGTAGFSTPIAGPGSLAVTNGSVVMNVANTHSGGTVLRVGSGSAALKSSGVFGSGPLSLQSGMIMTDPFAYTLTNAVTLDGDFSFGHYDGGSSWNGGVTFTAPLVLNGNFALIQNGYTYQPQTVTFSAGIGDGGQGYNLTVKNGPFKNNGIFYLGGASTYTGTTVVHGATLQLNGSLTTPAGIEVNRGGVFHMQYDTAGADLRLDNAIPIRLRGGRFSENATQSDSTAQWEGSETVGTMTLEYGHSTIQVGGGRSRSVLTITNMVRQAGSTAFLYRLGSSSAALGSYGYGRIYLSGQPDGFMGGWASARRNEYVAGPVQEDSGYDFAWYSNNTVRLSGVLPLGTLAGARPSQVEGAASGDHVCTVGSQNALTAATVVNSLAVTNGCDNDLGGYTLDIVSGGLLNRGGNYTMLNGTLTSSGGALCLVNYGTAMTNQAVIAGSGVSVSTAGSQTLAGNNTFSGKLYVNSGTLLLSGANTGMSEAIVAPAAVLQLGVANALPAAAKLSLLYDGDDYGKVTNSLPNAVVRVLTLNGVKQLSGTYGATGSGCQYTNNNYFAGAGTLKVSEPAGLAVFFW